MGPPPKYLIERKLIRSVSKKVVPKNPLIPSQYFSGLVDCWKTFGLHSDKCMDEQLKYDFAQNQTLAFKKKLQKMSIRQIVSQELRKPIYPFELKGRHTAERRHKIGTIKLTDAFF